MRLDRQLDHAAFLTWDTEATHDFYVHVMGWPLVVAWGRESGDQPFFITGYDAGGWVIEFEEMVGLAHAEPAPAPAFPHFGFTVDSEAEVSAWAAHLDDHDVAYVALGGSVYWTDPNAVTFQLFQRTDGLGSREERIHESERNFAAWVARSEPAEPSPEVAPSHDEQGPVASRWQRPEVGHPQLDHEPFARDEVPGSVLEHRDLSVLFHVGMLAVGTDSALEYPPASHVEATATCGPIEPSRTVTAHAFGIRVDVRTDAALRGRIGSRIHERPDVPFVNATLELVERGRAHRSSRTRHPPEGIAPSRPVTSVAPLR